jgi:hypothetical protein
MAAGGDGGWPEEAVVFTVTPVSATKVRGKWMAGGYDDRLRAPRAGPSAATSSQRIFEEAAMPLTGLKVQPP